MIYILHLNTPLKHARHYVGWAQNVEARIAHHRAGTGAKFTKVLKQLGITFQTAAVFEGDRTLERSLKNQKHTARYCPICNPKAKPYRGAR